MKIPISLTEEIILNPSALSPALRGFRMYRVEYGGHGVHCLYEGRIMLPPDADPEVVEMLLDGLQE